MRIAINGAGIAGSTAAFWLGRSGHDVTIFEEAPELRSGGYIIDFWGLGYDVAEKMGIIGEVRRLGYQVQEVRFVDEKGRKNGGFTAGVFERMTDGRFTSIRRSDLARTIYGALDDRVKVVFGDSIESIEDIDNELIVGFRKSAPREFDLVIGADGLHSRVREIVFVPQTEVEVSLGFHVGAFELEGYSPRDELVYLSHAAPGRQLSRFSMRDDKTLFLFVFRDEYLKGSRPTTESEKKTALREAFGDVGWECPDILNALENVEDIYFDRVSQIRMDRWTRGRVALLGDAAACVSLLAGEGTGLAMTEAYVLAGALAQSGSHSEAFNNYEKQLKPFLERKQASAAKFASSFAPATKTGIAIRNLITKILRINFIADYFIGSDLRDDLELPDYFG
jgi:2-polyprenyl-6-methoxyphenol hydroxylase-like FAD-dependent oxidoreductase